MKKLLVLLSVVLLVSLGSGLVIVESGVTLKISGDKKVLNGPVGDYLDDIAAMVAEAGGTSVSLKIKKTGHSYLVDDGKHDKWQKTFDGFQYVELNGKIKGADEKLSLESAIDYSKSSGDMMATTMIGDKKQIDLDRTAYGDKATGTLTRVVSASTTDTNDKPGMSGNIDNIINNTNVWHNSTVNSSLMTATTDGLTSSTSLSTAGAGSYSQTVGSTGALQQLSVTTMTVPTPIPSKNKNK